MNNKSINISWLDDKKNVFKSEYDISKKLVHHGVNTTFKKFQSPFDFIEYYKKETDNIDIVFLDIDLNNPEINGIQVYNKIREINSTLICFFVSCNLFDIEWEEKINKIKSKDNYVYTIELPLPTLRSQDYGTLVIDPIIGSLNPNLHPKKLPDPFMYTLKDFLKLTEEERNCVFNNVSRINSKFVDGFFKNNPEKDWMIIAKREGNIIASGNDKDEPFHADLMKLAKENNAPVYTYSRPKIIEQIDMKWSPKHSDDYYPTVTLDFNSNKDDKIIKGDFDTGSTHSYISYEELLKRNIIEQRILRTDSAILWNKKFTYFRNKLKCKLWGKRHFIYIDIVFMEVKDWDHSPLISNYKNRIALIGRNLILENAVKLILDGENKETSIII